MYGSSGDSGEKALSNDSATMFDRASSDVFTFNCKDLGDIKVSEKQLFLLPCGSPCASSWSCLFSDTFNCKDLGDIKVSKQQLIIPSLCLCSSLCLFLVLFFLDSFNCKDSGYIKVSKQQLLLPSLCCLVAYASF